VEIGLPDLYSSGLQRQRPSLGKHPMNFLWNTSLGPYVSYICITSVMFDITRKHNYKH